MRFKLWNPMYFWDNLGVLCSFEDEQYPSNSVNPWCLIIEYPNEGISVLIGFGRAMHTPSHVKIYVMEPNVFLRYLEKGIACSLCLFGQEQYPLIT